MTQGAPMTLSVIVPVLNDAIHLRTLSQRLKTLPHIREIIVSDGGSKDEVEAVVGEFSLTLVSGARGRGSQMNKGAETATGEILWFLHADTLPATNATESILGAIRDPRTVGGAFRFHLAEPRWYGPLLNVAVNLRSKWFSMPYGDQGFFVRREVFERIGGFPDIPIMEDVEFLPRVKPEGDIALLDTPIEISPRRWDREGFLKRTLLNWLLMLRWRRGASPEDLLKFYRPGDVPPQESGLNS
ncbi:MAG: TIGR04283 family arsenosugar biosynthesis glycosyltransferase [Candidatus Omnitrophica bacterium]|nr:TIGR04283 family arsenosugar biosynthesis glycosyltransferase [Candidatus Omnitrophota bacterium]